MLQYIKPGSATAGQPQSHPATFQLPPPQPPPPQQPPVASQALQPPLQQLPTAEAQQAVDWGDEWSGPGYQEDPPDWQQYGEAPDAAGWPDEESWDTVGGKGSGGSKPQRSSGRGGGAAAAGGAVQFSDVRLWIRNLQPNTTERDVERCFARRVHPSPCDLMRAACKVPASAGSSHDAQTTPLATTMPAGTAGLCRC